MRRSNMALFGDANKFAQEVLSFGKNFKIINFLFEFFAKYNLFKFPNLKRFDAFSQLI